MTSYLSVEETLHLLCIEGFCDVDTFCIYFVRHASRGKPFFHALRLT